MRTYANAHVLDLDVMIAEETEALTSKFPAFEENIPSYVDSILSKAPLYQNVLDMNLEKRSAVASAEEVAKRTGTVSTKRKSNSS